MNWLFTFLMVCGLTANTAQSQDSDEGSERERLVKMVQEQLVNGIREVLSVEYQLLIKDQAEFFELDQSATKKLLILSKGIVAKDLKKLTDATLAQKANQALNNVQPGNTFTVNGTKFTLPDQEEEDPCVDITVSIVNGTYLWMESKTTNQSTGNSLFSIKRMDLVKNEKWRKLLEASSDKPFDSYQEDRTKKLESNIADFMLAIVSDSLVVSKDQEAPLKEWLVKRAKYVPGQTLFQNAKTNIQQCKERPTEILTPTQIEGWRVMLSEVSLN